MKTNKNRVVPKLRFPEFRDGGDWSVSPLNKLGKFTGGGTPSKANSAYWQGSYPWISSSDISEESIYQINIRRFITKEAIEQSATKEVPENSILLLSRVGIGKLAISKNPVYTSQDFTSFTPKGDNLLFIAYQLKSKAYKFFDFSQGMGIQGFTKDDISNFLVFTTSLPEQQKIADCLSSLDILITAENEQLDTLKEYKAGLLQQLFPAEGKTTPTLRFTEFKDDGNWEEVKLVDVAETSIGLVTTMTTSYVEKGIPLIINSDIKPNAIRMTKLINLSKEFADKYENKRLLKNDIVTVHTGDIGVSALVEQDLEGSLGFATLNTRVTSSSVSPEFVCWFFNSPEYKRFALSMATGDGRNNFNLRDFNKTILFIPDILEQQKVVDCLSSLDNLIQAKDEKIKTLKEHKKGLMQQLFPVTDDK